MRRKEVPGVDVPKDFTRFTFDGVSPFGMPTVPCLIVRCGTSRFAVLIEDDKFPQSPVPEDLADLMIGEPLGDGLSGEHYQMNKVGVVSTGVGRTSYIPFRFFQIDHVSRSLLAVPECANGAAAAGLAAVLTGLRLVDGRRRIGLRNMTTEQRIEVTPSLPRCPWSSDWNIKFLFEKSYTFDPVIATITPIACFEPQRISGA